MAGSRLVADGGVPTSLRIKAELKRQSQWSLELQEHTLLTARFKIRDRRGSNAPGGALNYVVKGKMIGGFALIAYPAEYGNSGVMTFMVNHGGTVYQKDLGTRTESIAKRI
jgi:Protein of unknown function (DUF2950)